MVDKIKKTDDLPSWFALSNYEFLADLGAAGWANVVNQLLTLYSSGLTKEDLDEAGRSLDEVFAGLFRGSLEAIPEHVSSGYIVDVEKLRFRSVASLDNGAVAYMASMLEALPFGTRLMEEVRDAGSAIYSGIPKVRRRRKKATQSQQAELIEFSGKPFFLSLLNDRVISDKRELTPNRAISVNMALPDALIIQDFKDWIKATRALDLHRAAQKVFDHDDFGKWIDDRYVPLLLLSCWARLAKVEISYPVLAESLYPRRGLIGESNIRRSKLPAAQAWLSYETREALAAQAAKEAGRNLSSNL